MWSNNTSVTLYLLLSLLHMTGPNSCGWNQDHLFTNGCILDGNSFWESKTIDATECAQMCVRMKSCKAFNFNTERNTCQLNALLGTLSASDANSVYSDISKWPSQIEPACFSRPCTEDEICIPQRSTGSCSYTCFANAKSLRCPIPEGTLSTQSRTIGSIYTHTCPRGSVGGDSALCLPSGKWNKTIETTCKPIFGDHCDKDFDCKGIGGECKDSVCRCKRGYGYVDKGLTCAEVCEEGWLFDGIKCYYFGIENMNWFDASRFCLEKGGQLVQVDTSEDWNFLNRTMAELFKASSNGKEYWIDLYQDGENGKERWKTSGSIPTFTAWATGEPNDAYGSFATERCTLISSNDFLSYEWIDARCINDRTPLCQKMTHLQDK